MKKDQSYFPQAFIPSSFEHAKRIVLTPDGSADKWARETESTVDQIISSFAQAGSPILENSVLLDYGCGVGRIAKRLIERTGCAVVGVDMSPKMLEYSFSYVNSPRFVLCPQSALATLSDAGLRFHGALAVWVLQHCQDPAQDLRWIHKLLRDEAGHLFVVNKFTRHLPVTPVDQWVRWADDQIDVEALIRERFEQVVRLPDVEASLYALFRKKFVSTGT